MYDTNFSYLFDSFINFWVFDFLFGEKAFQSPQKWEKPTYFNDYGVSNFKVYCGRCLNSK